MALKTLFFVLTISCVTFAVLIEKCPPKESTACSCFNEDSRVYLVCHQVGSWKVFQDNFKALRGYLVQQLSIVDVNASTLPIDLFRGLHVKELVLENFEVGDASFRPGQTHFLGLENSLEVLLLINSFKRKMPLLNLKLDHLHSLKRVGIVGNHIDKIGNDWFIEGPKNLNFLEVSESGIEKLGDKAFASLKNLQTLYLTGNSLEEISRSMLPFPAHHLEDLDFGQNKLRTLPSDIFSAMPALKLVGGNGNLIHALPEETWSSILPQLQYLYFRGNPLRCDQGLKWICDYNTNLISGQCASPVEKKDFEIDTFCRREQI